MPDENPETEDGKEAAPAAGSRSRRKRKALPTTQSERTSPANSSETVPLLVSQWGEQRWPRTDDPCRGHAGEAHAPVPRSDQIPRNV